MSVTTQKETLGFQTEVKQLLQLMIHSLYSNKEIFLRELVSNASDAADKLRFEALSDNTLYGSDTVLKIRIAVDKAARTIMISDNGIGMSRDEVVAAIASCHPVIEVLESGLVDPLKATRLSMIADLQMHGGFVYGPAYADWQSIDFSKEKVTLVVDGVVRVERTGSNTSGDLIRLLPWLANEGAARTGGLKAGQWVTTGSWTGASLADAASVVSVEFATVGRVGLRFVL